MGDKKDQVEELKTKGNAALKDGKVDEAVEHYTAAITLEPDNHVLYSNRSAAYCKASKYENALEDAEKVLQLKPDWPKGYSRKGAALGFLSRHEEAMMAYMEGLNYDSTNEQLKQGIKESKKHLTGPAGSQPLVNPFADADLWTKIEQNPTTKEYLKDPDYRSMVEQIQKSPDELGKHMQDARIMTTLGMLLGVDLQMKYEDEIPESPRNWPTPMETSPPPETSKAKSKANQADDLSDDQKEAQNEKEKGNAAYKQKDFESALQHYGRAIDLDPTNVTFRTNRAAVYFEQQEYDKCIEECQAAVDIGRENRADYKLIAKALARIGNAYSKKDDLNQALTFYNKSLSEHRAPDIMKKAQEVDKFIKERERLAYIDPEKSLEEKKTGNEAFQKGDYPTALKHYTEAIKRNPEDAKLFSNRAACYTKLAEFGMALKDCDECIRLDPKFVKGYLRKGASLLAMKDTAKAMDAYQKALEVDPNCQEAIEGYRRCSMQQNDPEAIKRRAMSDPEIQQILADPAMQLILQQMQKDPRALQEHLQNPDIAAKIQKLMESGLIAIR